LLATSAMSKQATKAQSTKSATGAANARRHPVGSRWQRMEAVFTYPGLYDFQDLLPGTLHVDESAAHRPGKPGRTSSYPDLLLFALVICSRICTSQRALAAELGRPGTWEEVCDLYREGLGLDIDLPAAPPSEDTMDRFVWRLADDHPASRLRWAAIQDRLTQVGYGTARFLGNFSDDHAPVDWTTPDHHHLVFGDGTFIDPMSDVLLQEDPITGEKVPIGSTAADPSRARFQEQFTDPEPDDKTARGINHVTLSTWTDYGWIVLGTAHATGGEIHPTMDLLDRLLDLAKYTVHTVVWDRVLTGWAIQSLMATRRVMVINKPVARDGFAPFYVDGQAFQPWRIGKRIAVERFETGQSLPLGTCIYRTTKSHERVNSQFYPLPLPESLATCPRQHHLWVDDGALFDCFLSDDGVWWKRPQAATAIAARPLPGPNDLWSLPITWHLACSHAAESRHEFTTHWQPAAGRTGRASKGISKALRELRPVPRYAVETFGPIHGLRSITESFNQWFQKTLGQHKRAMRGDAEGQEVDHLAAAMLANSVTYYRYLLCTDDD
jgi:hypothetical protein